MTEFSKRLQKLMDEYNMTPADVVQRSKQYDEDGKGISKVNMSQWLSGTYTPSTKKIAILSTLFNVNPNYLMGNTDEAKYDQDKLEKEAELCDLMQKCYGKEAYRIVQMYLMLNEDGRDAAFERIQELTQLPKFTVKGDNQKMA